jgi:hypothetical protein
MPIKFRCPLCEGMLSIARRKAGSQVVCPRCGDEVTVPDADLAAGDFDAEESDSVEVVAKVETGGNGAPKKAEPPLFKPGELDRLLGTSETLPPAPVVPKPPSVPVMPEMIAPPAEDGVLLSRGTLVVLVILVVVLIALAFATGYLIGS